MREKIQYLRKNPLFEVFLLAVLNEPAFVSDCLPAVEQMWDILKIICAVYIIICAAEKRTDPLFFLLQFVFAGVLFLSTVINGGSLHEWFVQNAYMLLLGLYLTVRLEEDAAAVIKSLSVFLCGYAALNFISFCLFPSGMYADRFHSWDCWFLGRDNSAALILLSAMYVSYLYAVYWEKKRSVALLLSICSSYGFMLFVRSATAVIAMTLWLFCLFPVRMEKWRTAFTMKRCLAAGAALHVFLVCLRGYRIFYLPADLLKKANSLQVRAVLWERVAVLIGEKPFWGHGIEETGVKTAKLGFDWAGTAHNYFLNIGYQGGFLALAVLSVILLVTVFQFDRLAKDGRSRVIPLTLLVVLLMFTVEAYQGSVWFWVLLLLAFRVDKIEAAGESQ